MPRLRFGNLNISSGDDSSDEDFVPPVSRRSGGRRTGDVLSSDDENDAVNVSANAASGNENEHDSSDGNNLPSVGNIEVQVFGNQNQNGVDVVLEAINNGDGSDDESLLSIEGSEEVQVEERNASQNESVNHGPVREFRVRVGPDGEELFEFASDSEEGSAAGQSDSDDNDPNPAGWAEQIGVQPAVDFDVNPMVISLIAARVGVERERQVTRRRRRRLGQGAPAPAIASTSRGQQSQTGSRRRKRRKRKAPKKKPARKPRPPPKPLGPLTIYEDWNGNEDFKAYSKLISSKVSRSRIYINVKETISLNGQDESDAPESPSKTQQVVDVSNDVDTVTPENDCKQESADVTLETSEQKLQDENSAESTCGYKIAEIKFDRCSTHQWTWRNKAELTKAFPNIIDLSLHVKEEAGASILHLKNKKTLEGEDVSQRSGPPPKLNKRDSARELIFVGTEHYFFHVDPIGVPFDLFCNRALGNRKTFVFDFNEFDVEKQCFRFDVILLDSAVIGDHDVHRIPQLKSPLMQEVFTNFFGVAHPPRPLENDAREKEDIAWFYGQIKKYHKQETLPPPDIPLQPPSLKPTLRNYQRDAVHWMLFREGFLNHCEAHSSTSFQARVDLIKAFIDKMYVPIELTEHATGRIKSQDEAVPAKKVAYYNLHTAYLCWNKPTVPPIPSGGILCDEMGLGKTVETLCLILLNQKKVPEELQDYFGNSTEEEVDETNDPASEFEDNIPSDSGESSSSDSGTRKRKLTDKKSKSRKPTAVSQASARPRYKSSKRWRASSPCEFTAAGDDNDKSSIAVTQSSPVRRRSSSSKRVTAMDYVDKTIKSNERLKRSGKGSAEQKKRPPLFEAMKVLYDSALNEYRYADYAKSTPKFHGKFYEVNLELREFFECICGESDDGCQDWEIIKCSVCSSSQHAQCVGFDVQLGKLFEKLGRGYLCPHCEALKKPFETKSTLIITPASISHQWIKEIQRHVQNHRLNILFYKGVSTHGYIPPAKLARYDIVITTYSVLSTELDYVDLPHCNSKEGRRFRNPKRFLTIPSPLPSVLWWRVCLDEAQMVEGISTKMSMMARKIQAVHRWCITGTPMNKGLQDLFGLFVFLSVYPICYDIWWDALVRDAFFRKETNLLYELFGQMIWRNGKQDVLDQLGIPPQTELVHWLNFSPVETHFYKQQFEICSNRIIDKINRLRRSFPDVDVLEARLTTLDRSSLNGLLAPFLELRQACCHPQIVKGQLISLQKGALTMEDLLERLVKKSQLQCIDDHRLIIAALNGMAGLYIIRDNFKEAATKYREVLQSAEKYKEHFQTDSLQLLHTLENLAEILDANHDGIPFTLRDENLRSDAAELRKKYMKRYADAVKVAQDVVTPLSNTVEEIYNQFTMVKESWWMSALKAAKRGNKIDGLIQTLKQDLLDVSKKNFQKSLSLANKFHDSYGLEHTLIPILTEIDQLRNTVLEGLQELQTNDPSVFVESAIRCHLRQTSGNYYNDTDKVGEKCKLCVYHDNFLFYESTIFKIESKDKISRTGRNWQQRKLMGDLADELELTETAKEQLLQQEAEDLKATTEHVQLINDELRRGSWADSETEVILKGILRFAKLNKLIPEIADNGQVHMKLFDALKKEFRFLRILWRQIYDQVSAVDELSQATTRMIAMKEVPSNEQPSSSKNIKQLKSGTAEKALKIQNIHVIAYHEIEPKMGQMQLDYTTGQETLSLHMGQLLYLKTLKKNGYGKKGTINTEDCPICSVQLGKEWSVLRCGHSFCSDCVKKMCPNTLGTFLCPLCRHSMKFADVSFVDTTRNDRMLNDSASGTGEGETSRKAREIMGSHSTKVEAIVETLLDLQEKHPGEKCIIFSMWSDVLEIIAKALDQNDIQYSLLTKSGLNFHMKLDKFKEREDLQVLLMPLTSGAKGLNIIEATHVLLVEPILNIASELQAIGRVHRIGQTKPTYVHRFYIKRTIEEKLFQILKGQDISSDEEGSLTVKDLQNLVSTTSA